MAAQSAKNGHLGCQMLAAEINWRHRRLAVQAGVDDSILNALADGTVPLFDRADEQAVYRFAVALVHGGHVDQSNFDATVDAIGLDSVIDLTVTIGYYCQISLLLNAFNVALPDGVSPTWTDH